MYKEKCIQQKGLNTRKNTDNNVRKNKSPKIYLPAFKSMLLRADQYAMSEYFIFQNCLFTR